MPSGQCRLLAGPIQWLTQALLAAAALGALLIKRQREKPQRPLPVWACDVSKQAVSSLAAHICGLVVAVLASTSTSRSVSPCAWYFVAFFIDTSLGVGLAVGLHQLVVMVARIAASDCGTKTGLAAALARPGSYGDPVNKCVFCVQLSEFTIAVIIARAACGSLIILFRHQLIHGAAMLDRAFRGHPNILLLSVMVACPLLMNLLQALVQDTVLKRKHQPGKSSPVDQTPPSSELGDNTHLIPSRANSSCMDLC